MITDPLAWQSRFHLIEGDITTLEVDAIVNAANGSLLGGGGVDGAIHRAAGRELFEECLSLNGCDTGDAKITGGYQLPAKHVIHTVGPVWQGGGQNEEELLASCYRRCLELVEEHQLRSVAFPAISTGIYRFPGNLAARIAVREITTFLQHHQEVEQVLAVCFDSRTKWYYELVLEELRSES